MNEYSKLFFTLMEEDELCSDTNICLITKESLQKNAITLKCGHSFNYVPLYNEVINQKLKKSNLDICRLSVNQIKCPYCRTIHNHLIPYVKEIDCVSKIYGVNTPMKYVEYNNKCEYVFKSGVNAGKLCNKSCLNQYCNSHEKYINKIKNQEELCSYKFKKGASKGKTCKCKIFKSGLCKKHFGTLK